MKITKDTPGVEVTLTSEPEEEDYRGNCSAIDDETDRETERWISDQLQRGNDWAWCWVKVEVAWYGFRAVDTLGMCSYLSEADFRTPGGYFDDMVSECLRHINAAYERAQGTAVGLARALQRTHAANVRRSP